MKAVNALRKMFLREPVDLADVDRERVLSVVSECYELPTKQT